MPAPAEIDKLPDEPFKLLTTLLGALWAGTEIVTLPAPTPTLAIPAPENTSPVEKVPVELLVVLPDADIETDAAAADGTEIVMLLLLIPTLAIPAPEMLRTLLNVPEELFVVFPTADKETVL